MTTIFEDLKQYLIDEKLALENEIKNNVSDTQDSQIILWQYGGLKTPVGILSAIYTIQIKVLDTDMGIAEERITDIYDSLVDGAVFKFLDERPANIYANQPPFYVGQDEQLRYAYILNIIVVTNR